MTKHFSLVSLLLGLLTTAFAQNPNGAFVNARGCVVCDAYSPGDTFSLDGGLTWFTAVDRPLLDQMYQQGSDMSRVCVSLVTNMNGMFVDSNLVDTTFNQDISHWDVSNVTDMTGMFAAQVRFNQNIGNWDVSNVTSMEYMFYLATRFNQNIGQWNVSSVSNFDFMLAAAYAFNQDLSGWCVANIPSLPPYFAPLSAMAPSDFPVWGTCPLNCGLYNLSSTPSPGLNYSQMLSWNTVLGATQYGLQYKMNGESNWTSLTVASTQRSLQNLAPGQYEARVYGIGLGDTSCTINFNIVCATDIAYTANAFQAGYLYALPTSSGRVLVNNISGGKSLYNIELENLSTNVVQRFDGRLSYNFRQLSAADYRVRVYDAFNCQAQSSVVLTVGPLDTPYIPNLISAASSSPNGFRPLWNRPRHNGQLSPGVSSYQLRVRNETDNQLVNLFTNITDTFFHVNNLTPGKLYRFNVRSRYNPGTGIRNSAYSIRRDRTLDPGGNKLETPETELQKVLRVYPNPTADLVFVESPLGSYIKLLDLQGRIMQSLMAEGPISSLDLSPYAQGTYLLEVNIQGRMHHQKVVKQ